MATAGDRDRVPAGLDGAADARAALEHASRRAREGRWRWRSRRGMRELDALLAAFIAAHAPRLSDLEAAHFEAILELPDAVLHDYLLGRDAPADPLTASLLERIRAAARA